MIVYDFLVIYIFLESTVLPQTPGCLPISSSLIIHKKDTRINNHQTRRPSSEYLSSTVLWTLLRSKTYGLRYIIWANNTLPLLFTKPTSELLNFGTNIIFTEIGPLANLPTELF